MNESRVEVVLLASRASLVQRETLETQGHLVTLGQWEHLGSLARRDYLEISDPMDLS